MINPIARGAALVLACACVLGACASKQRPRLNDRAEMITRSSQIAAAAQAAERDGNLDRAIDLYREAANLNPDFGAAWNNIGTALMKRGKETDRLAAQQALQRAAAALPTDPTPYRNLGILYQQLGYEEDALRYFEQALEIAPNDRDSLRGAIMAGKLLIRSDEAGLDRLRRAALVEADKDWQDLIRRERIRVENDLEEMDRQD